jgi:hypothetical protein
MPFINLFTHSNLVIQLIKKKAQYIFYIGETETPYCISKFNITVLTRFTDYDKEPGYGPETWLQTASSTTETIHPTTLKFCPNEENKNLSILNEVYNIVEQIVFMVELVVRNWVPGP